MALTPTFQVSTKSNFRCMKMMIFELGKKSYYISHSVLLTIVLHDLILRATRNRSTVLFVVQPLERPYHFGMGDRAFLHLSHAHLVVTWKKLCYPIPERYAI